VVGSMWRSTGGSRFLARAPAATRKRVKSYATLVKRLAGLHQAELRV